MRAGRRIFCPHPEGPPKAGVSKDGRKREKPGKPAIPQNLSAIALGMTGKLAHLFMPAT